MSPGENPFPTIPKHLVARTQISANGRLRKVIFVSIGSGKIGIPAIPLAEIFEASLTILHEYATLPIVASFIKVMKKRKQIRGRYKGHCGRGKAWNLEDAWPKKDPSEPIPSVLLEEKIELSNGVKLSPAALLWLCQYLIWNLRNLPSDPRTLFFKTVDAIII